MNTYVRFFWLVSILAFLGWAIWRIGYSLKSPIESVRIKCVERMTDQDALADIALNSNDSSLVKIATSKVTNPDVIATLLLRDDKFSIGYRYDEIEKLVEKLDQKTIAVIAMNRADAKSRAIGISHLTDQDALAKVALTDAIDENRMLAFGRIEDAESLRRAAATGSALSKNRAEGLGMLLHSLQTNVSEEERRYFSDVLVPLVDVASEPVFQACVGRLKSLGIDNKRTFEEYYDKTVTGDDITVHISFGRADQSFVRKELIHVETSFPSVIYYHGKTPPDRLPPDPSFWEATEMAIRRLLHWLSQAQIAELASSGASQTVRLYCIANVTDTTLLRSLSRNDNDWKVREAAESRFESIYKESLHK